MVKTRRLTFGKFFAISMLVVLALHVLMIIILASTPVFGDISECEQIEKIGIKNAKVTRYDDTSKDVMIGDLEYKEFYGAMYRSTFVNFEIFVYEFEDNKNAGEYMSRMDGVYLKRENLKEHIGTALLFSKILSYNKVIVIYGDPVSSIILLHHLKSIFTETT